jgi:abortive infection bacteriophage resistance protein
MGGFSMSTIPAPRIPFTKPALSLADQLNKLRTRGLIISDPAETRHYLEHIGYYRLSGYMMPFQIGGAGLDKHNFRPGTTFDDILDCYVFDRKLRLIVMDAVERIEISIRSALSNSIAVRHGPNWYQDSKKFNPEFRYVDFIDQIKMQISHDPRQSHKRDAHINHYYTTYNAPDLPPCWMIFESISFGLISLAFKNLVYSESKPICDYFSLNHKILSSWLHSISYTRNICAHHARLWNRTCTIKPFVAKAFKDELTPNDRLYAQLVVMQVLLGKIAPDNHWAQKIAELFEQHPRIPLAKMGFPTDWKSRKLWRIK